jgi:SAM-dependent methyltransferase
MGIFKRKNKTETHKRISKTHVIKMTILKSLSKSTGSVLRKIRYAHVRGRQAFNYQGVVSGWGQGGAGLPNFSSRLYHEVMLLNEAIGDFKAKRSLEIGCGYGRLTPWIMQHSEQHYAIEPETKLLNDAKKLYPDTYFYNYRVQDMTFPDSVFDLCVSWTVLQHIPPEQFNLAITQLKRVCSRKSVIILCEAVAGTLTNKKSRRTWERSLFDWSDSFFPWELKTFKRRKIERTFKGDSGFVMRFERNE